MGTQRILSKLSDAGTMPDPTKATKAAGGTTSLMSVAYFSAGCSAF